MRKTSPSLRHAMDYLHTWLGVLFSALLFLVFFMGSLSVFDREIDRWMMPATRIAAPQEVSFDRQIRPHLEALAGNATQWFAMYPNEREATARIGWREGKEFVWRHIDIERNVVLPEVGTWGGSGFFFPFHYSFHIKWKDVGYWLLALVGTGMLVLLISGVIVHKKIFADLFLFRRGKAAQRMTLDVHNICGVFILPFHFLIAWSGLIIFLFTYFLPAIPLLYGADMPKARQEAFNIVTRPAAKAAGQLTSVDAMVAEAQARWGGGHVRNVSIANPHDRNALVQVLRQPDDRVGYETMTVYFDGDSGAVMGQQGMSATLRVQRFFAGLHMIPFSHWGLRWLYFVMGLAGCVLIASGMLLWVEKRRMRHIREGRSGYRVVDAVACAGAPGTLVATLAMLVANRLLPLGLAERPSREAAVFFVVWALMLLHAAWRGGQPFGRKHWEEQAWLIAILAAAAVVLNAVTTGDHLLLTLWTRQWAIAGMDGVLLTTAAIAAACARRLHTQRPRVPMPASATVEAAS